MQIGMPLRNLIAIIGSVVAGVLGYTQLEGRLNDLETQSILIESRVDSNSSWKCGSRSTRIYTVGRSPK